MFNIRDFLKKASNKQAKEIIFRQAVRDSVKKIANIDVLLDNVHVKSSVVFLKDISQAARSVIFVKKQAILEELNKSQDAYKISDIR